MARKANPEEIAVNFLVEVISTKSGSPIDESIDRICGKEKPYYTTSEKLKAAELLLNHYSKN